MKYITYAYSYEINEGYQLQVNGFLQSFQKDIGDNSLNNKFAISSGFVLLPMGPFEEQILQDQYILPLAH